MTSLLLSPLSPGERSVEFLFYTSLRSRDARGMGQNLPSIEEALPKLWVHLWWRTLRPDRIPCSGSCAVCLLDSGSPGRICGH